MRLEKYNETKGKQRRTGIILHNIPGQGKGKQIAEIYEEVCENKNQTGQLIILKVQSFRTSSQGYPHAATVHPAPLSAPSSVSVLPFTILSLGTIALPLMSHLLPTLRHSPILRRRIAHGRVFGLYLLLVVHVCRSLLPSLLDPGDVRSWLPGQGWFALQSSSSWVVVLGPLLGSCFVSSAHQQGRT